MFTTHKNLQEEVVQQKALEIFEVMDYVKKEVSRLEQWCNRIEQETLNQRNAVVNIANDTRKSLSTRLDQLITVMQSYYASAKQHNESLQMMQKEQREEREELTKDLQRSVNMMRDYIATVEEQLILCFKRGDGIYRDVYGKEIVRGKMPGVFMEENKLEDIDSSCLAAE